MTAHTEYSENVLPRLKRNYLRKCQEVEVRRPYPTSASASHLDTLLGIQSCHTTEYPIPSLTYRRPNCDVASFREAEPWPWGAPRHHHRAAAAPTPRPPSVRRRDLKPRALAIYNHVDDVARPSPPRYVAPLLTARWDVI